MLIYHQAFDLYHGIFRMMKLLNSLDAEDIIWVDQFRILDFYLLFPSQLLEIKFPTDARRYRKTIQDCYNSYESISDSRRLFWRLEPYQTLAIKALVAYGFIDNALFVNDRKIQRTNKSYSNNLQNAIENISANEASLLELLTGPLRKVDLYGNSGLKARTGLFEYRYDIV